MLAERQITCDNGTKSAARRWRAAVALADRQFGVVSLAQLVALRVDDSTVRRWVAVGRLQRMHQGVFAVGHRALRREGWWMAAVLACGESAVLSHRPAGALQDLCAPPSGLIDVTVPGRIGRSRRGIRVHSGDRLPADEVTVVDGIPCTNVPRTIIDLASTLQRRALEGICERAARIQVLDAFELGALLARHRGRRGAGRLRAVLTDWDTDLANTNSELEARFLRLVAEARIERPVVNGLVEVNGRTFEVDFHWPLRGAIVETDGGAFHDNPLARVRDAHRDRILSAAGWTIDRLRWDDVVVRPERGLLAVRRLLSASGR
jgi:very-short-patch-repair endonuclease